MLTIEAHISTPSPVLDLGSTEPFEIVIELFLKHHSPISFSTDQSNIFNVNILHDGGLTFTDVSTGEQISRNTRFLCGGWCDGILSAETEMKFKTLYPEQPYVREASFGRIKWKSFGSLTLPTMATIEQYQERVARLPDVWKWQGTGQLKDGRTYEIEIGTDATIHKWLEGAKEDLLAKPVSQRDEAAMRTEAVTFQVITPARFLVRRPDTDGSLDWP